MYHEKVSRREMIQTSAIGAAWLTQQSSLVAGPTTVEHAPVRVAAVQMRCILGDVDANLENAENWVLQAVREGARWVVLPELFTSGNGHDLEKTLYAHRPLDGEPMQLMKRLAHDKEIFVAGSILAESGGDVFNTFVLACPDGTVCTHDKDLPSTEIEASFFAGGEDAEYARILRAAGHDTIAETVAPREGNNPVGAFQLDDISIGAALCWEQVRYRTARRLSGKVDMVLACSSWPFPDHEVGVPGVDKKTLLQEKQLWLKMIQQAPRRMARMLGTPVVHANVVGDTWAYSTLKAGERVLLRFFGESLIVDAQGKILKKRSYEQGEGLVLAEVSPGRQAPSELIPNEEWIPEVLDSEFAQRLWYTGAGRDRYLTETRQRRRVKNNCRFASAVVHPL